MIEKNRRRNWRWQRRIAVSCLWFTVCDMTALGFGRWSPFIVRYTMKKTMTRILKDSYDNFPTTLNVPMPDRNITSPSLPLPPTTTTSGLVPPEKLQFLQENVDLVSVIQTYGLPQFKRYGDHRATCLCPFHDDHNPSMSIDGVKGIYKCFSCGAGGNVFTFVREYAKLQGEEISFIQAVHLVSDGFASENSSSTMNPLPGMRDSPWNTNFNHTTKKPASSSKGSQAKRNRILSANAAAVTFYENCLVSKASAGPARTHLRTRGISPRTVKAFAIGYAPDAYFGRQNGIQDWGEGSLVEHLKEKGFTPAEILDAGLATIVKKDLKQLQDQGDANESAQVPYSSLMDRFRGRLVVPILDESGSQVLGFGGRILEYPNDNDKDSSKFSQPKYLNSPETLVFQKKNILFGQHMATKALRFWDKQEGASSKAVVIVEGYMDAIALWQAGVCEAVASMGTGLTMEQVSAAATLAGTKNGRVIFCLDNDDAGTAAIERLCRSGILLSVADKFPVEFRVSSLPSNIKDPADYIDINKNERNLDNKFREDVLERNSLDWMDWYQRRILSQYNATAPPGEKGSFSDIMDHFGVLLSMVKDISDKNKRFNDIIDILVIKLASETNETHVSETVRLQLQSELERKSTISTQMKQSSLTGRTLRQDIEKASKLYARIAPSNDGIVAPPLSKRTRQKNAQQEMGDATKDLPFQSYTAPAKPIASRSFRAKNSSIKRKPSLTPHFAGFDFQSTHDTMWLEDAELTEKWKSNAKDRRKSDGKIVYFNSNEYHGGQFITDEAVSAGYTNEFVPRDPELLAKGINSMVDVKADRILESAEDDLLRILLNFPIARLSLQRIMAVSRSAGSQEQISWTSPEKQWLFYRLTSDDPALTSFGRGNLMDFQVYLARQEGATRVISFPNDLIGNNNSAQNDCDAGLEYSGEDNETTIVLSPTETEFAESKRLGGEESRTLVLPRVEISPNEGTLETPSGKLDYLFHDKSARDNFLVLESDDKAELRVQEAYLTMLWSSSILTLSQKQEEMTFLALKSLSSNESTHLDDSIQTNMSSTPGSSLLDSDDLDTYQSLRSQIQDATNQVRVLSDSLHGLSSRLIKKAMPDEGSFSEKWQEDYSGLCARLTKHMRELESWSILDEADVTDDDSYETTLERAQLDWGDLYEDDRIWTSTDVMPTSPLPPSGLGLVQTVEEKESITDFSERINQDWGWLDEPYQDLPQEFEKSGPYEFDEQQWDQYLLEGT